MPNTQYSQFRIHLAITAIRELLSAIQHNVLIVCFSVGIGLLGLLAFIALPLFYAPLLSWPKALAVLIAQSALMALPVLLLKTTILPLHVRPWLVFMLFQLRFGCGSFRLGCSRCGIGAC
jgi:hypothetical protein